MSVGLSSAIAAEWFRFRRRRFAWIALATITLAGFLGAVAPHIAAKATAIGEQVGGSTAAREAAKNAFYYLATGSRGVAVLTAMFVALAAAPAIAGEFAQGTLRVALARPVQRFHLFAAKGLVLGLFGAMLLVVGCAAAMAGAALVSDFGPIAMYGYVKSTAGAMVGRFVFALLVSELAVLGTLALSLFASTVAESAASATSATLGVLVVMALGAFGFEPAKPYLFAAFTTSPFDTMKEYALAIDAPRPTWFGMSTLQDWADATFAVALPASTAAILLTVAARIFVRRDWLA